MIAVYYVLGQVLLWWVAVLLWPVAFLWPLLEALGVGTC